MTILIGDSGATTTNWALYDNKKDHTSFFDTQGLSPVFMNDQEIEDSLRNEVLPHLGNLSIEKVFFYGAGCARGSRQQRMRDVFVKVFSSANVFVEGDLVAVARALCGTNRGIIAILGTGSASGLCDQGEITDQVKSLGFYIGDEGGAAHLGRLLLQSYYYRDLPETLRQLFEEKYKDRIKTITEDLYASSTPSRYVGDFAKFCSDYKTDPFIQGLIKQNFKSFVMAHIKKYDGYQNLPLSIIGSTAHHFETELREVLAENGIQVKKIVDTLIYDLALAHKN